ncbi:uncharacterized protein LOC143432560 [Xylocopa sonorina]|uniref:uncharacterized protein LOC143432560 n=1 Tax=Xylocopa sonorina TaxID=1818115 RepID=UPI00403A9E63
MGTMGDNFAAVLLLLAPMLSTSESLSLRGNGNSYERNSSPDALTLDPPSTSPPIYECLFIDSTLPVCDTKWMLSSEEDPRNNRNLFNKDVRQRSRRSIDISAMDVVVYTFEGCSLTRLPFSMPSCDGISLNRIVDVQKFRPFPVKGPIEPPFIFPKFNYSEWLRTMTRLKNHVSSTTRDGDRDAIAVEESIQGRTEELMNAATRKETMPNAMAASMNSSNGLSANELIPGNSKHPKSDERFQGKPKETSNGGRAGPPVFSSFSSVEIPSYLQFRDHFSSIESDGAESRDHSKPAHLLDQTNGAAPGIPIIPRNRIIYEQSLEEKESSNGSKELSRLLPGPGIFRRQREISPVSEETRPRGIAGQSIAWQTQRAGKESSSKCKFHFVNLGKHKKRFRGLKCNQPGFVTANTFETAIPSFKKESDSRSKIDPSSDSKTTWRKSASKEATSTKKDGATSRVELPSFRNH